MSKKMNGMNLLLYAIFIINVVLFTILLISVQHDSKVLLIAFALLVGVTGMYYCSAKRNRHNLHEFTYFICSKTDDILMNRTMIEEGLEEETDQARILHRLLKLYDVINARQDAVKNERKKLQMLITDISHQVRTPLSNIKLINEMLLNWKDTEEKRLQILKEETNQIEKVEFLLQGLLKTSRLEAGTIAMKKISGNIRETISVAVGEVYFAAEKKQIQIFVLTEEEILIPHDVKWTTEAIYNILDNAVKYTNENGYIKIKVIEEGVFVRIDIEDNGKGIKKENLGRIFTRFYREDDVADKQGIGVGLYLSKEIIELQGGYIKVRSNINVGTTFSVFLPRDVI